MQLIDIPASDRTPRVHFDPQACVFEMAGESYPEDAAGFFGPILLAIKDFVTSLETPSDHDLKLIVHLAYFNSSSAKALMNLFQTLEDAAKDGLDVQVQWIHQEEDETMQEFGEDFAEDFAHLTFSLDSIP